MSGAARQVEAGECGGARGDLLLCAVLALVAAASALGCSSSAPPPAKPPTPKAATASSPPAASPAPVADNKPTGDSAPADETASVPEAGEIAEPQDAGAADEGAPADEVPAERFALLTPGGPLIVEVSITVDGKSLADAAAAAAREDAEAGGVAIAGSEEASEAASDEGGDEASDDEASDDERVARYFRIRSSRSYSPDPRRTSLLWPLLDADGDGLLDEREIASAAARLWSRDADDDRVIRPAEVASLREQLDGSAATAMGRRSASGPSASRLAALPLGPDCNLDRVDFVFQDLYAPQQDLSPGSFADLPSLFTSLDANGDQWIERDELAKVQSVDPHLRLAVIYTSTGENADNKAPKQARLELRAAAEEVRPLDGSAADRALFALGETRVLISAHDMSGAPNPRTQPTPMQGAAAPVGVRLMVHDRGDAIFEALDANADGVLGEREVAGAAALLAARDASGDGRLSVDETPYQMIVAFLYGEAPGGPSYFAPPAPPRPADEAPPAAWFVAADLNGDGDVSRREFLGDAATFAKADANADGYIDGREAAPTDADPTPPAEGDSAAPADGP